MLQLICIAAMALDGTVGVGPAAFEPTASLQPEHAGQSAGDHEDSAFSVREVEFSGGAEDVKLSGTVLMPSSASIEHPVAGIVLITGSGAQDRDETIMGRRPFKLLAEGLAARGYAVLRYDDRGTAGLGIGKSTGVFPGATLEDFSGDSGGALAYLGSLPEVNAKRLVACGHSTGGLETAMLVGDGSVTGAAVLLATPMVRGEALVRRQSRDILAVMLAQGESSLTDEQVRRVGEMQDELMLAMVSDDEARIQAAADAVVRFSIVSRSPSADVPQNMVDAGVKQTVDGLKAPWMAHFLRYDPGTDLRHAGVPMLAIFGGRDLQVNPQQNAPPACEFLSLAGDPRSKIMILATANHLFQSAVTGLPDEYGTLEGEMGPVADLVADWLDAVFAGE